MTTYTARICAQEGCNRDARKRGWCAMHYERLRHRGQIEMLPVLSMAERLAAGLVRMPNGCLEWTGHTSPRGYGLIGANGKAVRAHRLAWELVNGPIPEGMFVCHECDNPPCCDVEHLFLGTPADNMTDMAAKGRARNGNENKTHCPRNHPYDEANTYVIPGGQGRRDCRACIKMRTAAFSVKQRERIK